MVWCLQMQQTCYNCLYAHAESSRLTLSTSATADRMIMSAKPHAAAQQQGPDTSLLQTHLQQQWDHAKNAYLGDIIIRPGSKRKVWWACSQCPDGHPHKWEASILNRSRGTGCPFCAGRAVCPHNSLATHAPAVAAVWSCKNEGTPSDYTVSSHVSVAWQCQHGHEWTAKINSRTAYGSGCPECFWERRRHGIQQRHPFLTHSKHAMMAMWDSEANMQAGLDPIKLTCCSGKVAQWICCKCPKGQPHRWHAKIYNVYYGSGCPCCCGRQACVCNSLQALYPDVAAEWDHDKNEGTPSDYTAQSNKKVWWVNKCRGEFQAFISKRTRLSDRREPGCRSALQPQSLLSQISLTAGHVSDLYACCICAFFCHICCVKARPQPSIRQTCLLCCNSCFLLCPSTAVLVHHSLANRIVHHACGSRWSSDRGVGLKKCKLVLF